MEIWTHGVGMSCGGNEYHHEIYHLVAGGMTLCGVEVKGKDWFLKFGFILKVESPPRKYEKFGIYDCQRCAKLQNKNG